MDKYELYDKIKFFTYRRNRMRFAMNDYKAKSSNVVAISDSDLKEIKKYWSQKIKYPEKYFNYSWFNFYNSIENDKLLLKYYIPDDFYYCYVDTFFSHPRNAELLDNKNLYDLLLCSARQPRTLVRIMGGVILDLNYRIISKEDAVAICRECGNVIIKRTNWSSGGKGISFWSNAETNKVLLDSIKDDGIIVQELVKQHDSVAKIHPSSINTVRIMTLLFNNKVHILSSVFRMGVNSSKVDNASSGGIVCGITENGQLKNVAYDTKGNRYDSHPQGMNFADVVIPNFHECVELVADLAPRFLCVSKLVSWDIAISQDGHPILIEVNLSYGELDFHQMNNGPIFGEMTDEILEYVIYNNKYIK